MKKKNMQRFLQYSSVGFASFITSLLTLFLLVNYFKVYYLTATAVGFIVGVSLNYTLNFRWVFRDSRERFAKRHAYFILFGAVTIVLTLLLMKFFVDIINVYYLFARTIAGGIVGILSFLMNSLFTFKTFSLKSKNSEGG